MYLIDTRKYDDNFLLAKILEKVDFTDEETKKLFKHFEIPTVDTVGVVAKSETTTEVVRCKDCRFSHMTYSGECKSCDKWVDDDDFHLTLYLDGDFYCAWGERKDG